MQMEISEKNIWIERIKKDYCTALPYIDVQFLETSKDQVTLLDGQVKVHPFDMAKAILNRDTFSKGKVDWATVIIQTDPEDRELKEDARVRLRKAADSGQPARVTKAMSLTKKRKGYAFQ